MERLLARIGEVVAVDGGPCVLRLWPYDLKVGEYAVTVSPDGELIAIGEWTSVWTIEGSEAKSWRRSVALYDRHTFALRHVLLEPWAIYALAFSPDSTRIVTVGGLANTSPRSKSAQPPVLNEIVVWSTSDGAIVTKLPFPEAVVEGIAWDGDRVCVQGRDFGIRMFDIATGEFEDRPEADPGLKERLATSVVEARPAPAEGPRLVRDRRGASLREGARSKEILPESDSAHGLEVSPDGQSFWVEGTSVGIWRELESGIRLEVAPGRFCGFDAENRPRIRQYAAGMLSPDGRHALVDDKKWGLEWRDAEKDELLATYPGEWNRAQRSAVAIAEKNQFALVRPGQFNTMPTEIWDFESAPRRVEGPHLVYSNAKHVIDPGATFFVLGVDGLRGMDGGAVKHVHIARFDIATGRCRWDRKHEPGGIGTISFGGIALDPRGEWVAFGCNRGDAAWVVLLDVATGEVRETIAGLREVRALGFTPDGRKLLAALDPECVSVLRVRE